jgi:hypothetical protein
MWNRVRYGPRLDGCPFGIALAAGFATAVAGSLLASLASAPNEATPRLVELSLVTAGSAIVLRNVAAALLTAGIAWSIYLGFLVGHAGELQWHGGIDLLRLGTLLGAALLGSAIWLFSGLRPSEQAARPREAEPGRTWARSTVGHARSRTPPGRSAAR